METNVDFGLLSRESGRFAHSIDEGCLGERWNLIRGHFLIVIAGGTDEGCQLRTRNRVQKGHTKEGLFDTESRYLIIDIPSSAVRGR